MLESHTETADTSGQSTIYPVPTDNGSLLIPDAIQYRVERESRKDKFKDRKGYQVLTLVSGDGTHPSNPKEYQNDFSEKALSTNGYNLRNYMTLRKYHEVMTKVLGAKSP